MASTVGGERVLVGFFESAHDSLEELGGDELTNRYFNLLADFIEKFSLRYDLRRPCILCPTLPGVFASLVRDLRALTNQDPHLDSAHEGLRESGPGPAALDGSEGRIKTCIQKQVNPARGDRLHLSRRDGTTSGRSAIRSAQWPHKKIKAGAEESVRLRVRLPRHPPRRHAATALLRAVDMRDMVAMSILLTGFTPYLENRLSADAIFGGSVNGAGTIPPAAPPAIGPAGVSGTWGSQEDS